MKCKLEINIIEKVGKILIFIPAIIMLSLFILALYSTSSGKDLSVSINDPVSGLLFNLSIKIGFLILIFVSIYEFIRTYREAVKRDK